MNPASSYWKAPHKTNGLKQKMATILCIPVENIFYDCSVDALICNCGCGMEISAFAVKEVTGSQESMVYRRQHQLMVKR